MASSAEAVTAALRSEPGHTLGGLLGVPRVALSAVAAWVGDFVRCIAPGGRPEQIERGKVAAGHLLDRFGALVAERRAAPADDLLSALVVQAERGPGEAVAATIATAGVARLLSAGFEPAMLAG